MTAPRRVRVIEALTVWSVILVVLLVCSPPLEFYLKSSDHGMQLALGRQVLFGRQPFLGTWLFYGPLVAYSSAAGLWLGHGLVPETVICSVGYAVALLVVYTLVARSAGVLPGLLSVIFALELLGRFYKWYYWLIPLLILHAAQSAHPARGEIGWRRHMGMGLIGGIGWLYRFDLGLASICFGALIVAMRYWDNRSLAQLTRNAGLLLTGFTMPVAVWLLMLVSNAGISGIGAYVHETFYGTLGTIEFLSTSIPTISWHRPLGVNNAVFALYILLPLVYGAATIVGFWRSRQQDGPERSRGQLLIAAGVLGAGIMPQALHRADVSHLLQVITPFLVAAPILIVDLWTAGGAWRGKGNRVGRVAAAVLTGALVVIAVMLIPVAGGDLSMPRQGLVDHFRRLEEGAYASGDLPVQQLVRALDSRIDRNARVLAAMPLAFHVVFFANRPVSGYVLSYAPGFIDSPPDRQRNMEEIWRNPPALIITDENFDSVSSTWPFRISQPELYKELNRRFPRRVSVGSFVLLLPQ